MGEGDLMGKRETAKAANGSWLSKVFGANPVTLDAESAEAVLPLR